LACWQPDGEFFIVPTGTTYKGIAEIQQAGKKSAAVIGGQPIEGRKQITHLSAGADWACVEYDTQATVAGPIKISPAGFEPYFEELSAGLAAAGADPNAAMTVRQALSVKYDIEVIGPPRQGAG
jgi:hypothetical protein